MPLAIGLGVERRAEALRISTSSRNLNGVTATSAGPWSCPDRRRRRPRRHPGV